MNALQKYTKATERQRTHRIDGQACFVTRVEALKELLDEGRSQREVAQMVGLSVARINQMINKTKAC